MGFTKQSHGGRTISPVHSESRIPTPVGLKFLDLGGTCHSFFIFYFFPFWMETSILCLSCHRIWKACSISDVTGSQLESHPYLIQMISNVNLYSDFWVEDMWEGHTFWRSKVKYCGLNVSASAKFMLKPNTQYGAFWRWLDHESRAPMNRITDLIKEITES